MKKMSQQKRDGSVNRTSALRETKEDESSELHSSIKLAKFVAAKLDSVLVKYPNKK